MGLSRHLTARQLAGQPDIPAGTAIEVIERVRVRMLPDGRLDRENAARYVGVKPKTMAQWQTEGKLRGIRLGGRVWYFKDDLDRLITAAGAAA